MFVWKEFDCKTFKFEDYSNLLSTSQNTWMSFDTIVHEQSFWCSLRFSISFRNAKHSCDDSSIYIRPLFSFDVSRVLLLATGYGGGVHDIRGIV